MRIRILHVADVHLDAPLGAFGELAARRRVQVRQAFARLPEAAEREEVSAVLVAGDLFDGPRPGEEARAVARETVRRLVEAGRAVVLVPGNHDAITLYGSPWEGLLPEGAHLFREPDFGPPLTLATPGGPLHVYGFAYDPARQPDPLSTFRRGGGEGAHVVLLHGSVPGAPHWEGGRTLRVPPDRLAALDADYVALGDHHRFRPAEEFDGLPACYPGSFAAVDFTETGPRGFVVAELRPGAAPSARLVESGVPPVAALGTVDVSGCADDVEAADRVAERVPAGSLPSVTLEGETDFPLDPERVEAHLAARFEAARVEDQTRFYSSRQVRELAAGGTVAAHVARLGMRRIEEAGDDESARRIRERSLSIALRALGVR